MRLKYVFLSLGLALTINANAADGNIFTSNALVWTVIAVVAIIALVVSSINLFRISRIKQMLEVSMMNQKDDLDLSFRKMRSSLSRDVKNLRREMGRKNDHSRPKKVVKPHEANKSEETEKPAPKKVVHKKRRPHIKQNTGSAPENKD